MESRPSEARPAGRAHRQIRVFVLVIVHRRSDGDVSLGELTNTDQVQRGKVPCTNILPRRDLT